MKNIILWLLFIIAAACAWQDDDYDNDDGICPLAVCHGIYVDTQYDIHHCGECDIKCFPNQICINGICTCPNNSNACGAACTACPTGQHCESFDDDYQCECDNTVGSCGSPGSCISCTGATPDCINGACTCPNNNNACGVDCIACLTGEHCESLDGGATYQCVCDNTVGSCGSPGSCISCIGATPECINGACTCPNNNNACGAACTACSTGQHCELVNGTYGCVCDNTPNSCGTPDPNSGICSICTGTNTPSCCDGTCTCPDTPTQCSSVTNCGACNTAAGEVCVNGICGCCVDNTCTQCPTGSTGCTSTGATTPGSCCIPNGGRTCNTNGDCCAGLICDATSSTCVNEGCFELSPNNLRGGSNDAFRAASCQNIGPITEAVCQNDCRTFPYYSLTYQASGDTTYCCICYNSNYHAYPLTNGDPLCAPLQQAANAMYGQYSGTPFTFVGPGSEYIHVN